MFSGQQAIDIHTEMATRKIRFHERRIELCSDEEDIRHLEVSSRDLQVGLKVVGSEFLQAGGAVSF